MADEVVLARFQADITDLQKELDKYIKSLEAVQDEEKDTQNQVKKTTVTETDAAKKRNAAIKSEINELQRLKSQRKLAFDPTVIDGFNKKISESERKIALLRGQTNTLGSQIKTSLAGVAAGIGAAFSVNALIQFSKASVNAFLEAEENANRLRFAVTQIGDAGEDAFNRLIQQSSRLQKTTIFSDDAVQQAQTILATVGLTANQIEEAIPIIADFAAATKQDIASAAQAFTGGLQGMGREFKRFNIEVSANQTVLENYDELLKGLATTQGAAEEATKSLTGQLQQQENAADELQERIGQDLAPAWVKVRKSVFEATLQVIEFFKAGGNIALSIFNQKIEELPGAFDEVTKRVKAQEEALLAVGFTQEEAHKNAIKDIRAEIVERLALRTEQARAIAGDKEATIEAKQLAVTRISGVKNELEVVKQLAAAQKAAEQDRARALTREQLRLKSIEELNELLKANDALNDSVSQSNVTLIGRELEARKKAADEAKKIQEKAAADLKALREKQFEDFKAQLSAEQDALLAAINRQEQARKDQDALLEFKVRFTLNLEGEDAAFDLARKALFQQFQDESIQADVTSNSIEEANAKKQKSYENYIAALTKLVGDFSIFEQKAAEKIVADWIKANGEILDISQQILESLNQIFANFSDARVTKIEKERDTQLEAFDQQKEAAKEALDKRRLTEKEFAEAQKEIERNRVKAEEDADKKIKAIKRKEFQADQIAALAQIAIDTAQNIVQTPALTAFYLALAAAQGAIVASKPNPYKKGTKKSKEGLAIVGEEGPEQMLLPRGTKILDSKRSRKYADVFDAMYDNRFEDFVLKEFATPILERRKEIHTEHVQRSLAENITKSMVINNITPGRGDFFLERIQKGGVVIKNVDELAEAIIRLSSLSPSRR